MLLAVIVFHAQILTGLARLWVIDDPLVKADAIVVLGGRPDLRAIEAARLYHQGIAPKILYMDVKLTPSAELGITLSEREITRRLLLSNNVPETAIEAIGTSVSSTFEEALTIQTFVATNDMKTLIIPTDVFHTRRVHWFFRKLFTSNRIEVSMRAIKPPEYSLDDWWQHEEGLIAFQNELVKITFYWLKY
ncbi:MAG TPA: YdcF family protein [Candidatus Paceibacterota bacterium]|nr:YdcF family protein [Candidatus Paceibacterota bacterium]